MFRNPGRDQGFAADNVGENDPALLGLSWPNGDRLQIPQGIACLVITSSTEVAETTLETLEDFNETMRATRSPAGLDW
jgi:hypothetical protein